MERLAERQTSLIRRICVGPDYKQSMKYTVGSSCLRNTATICEIMETSANVFEISIQNEDNEVYLWKTVRNMPVVVENVIDIE